MSLTPKSVSTNEASNRNSDSESSRLSADCLNGESKANADEKSAELANHVRSVYQHRNSKKATHCVAAPGRVNFIGEHLDYNDGFVMPLAIDRFVCIAGGSDPDFAGLEFYSEQLQQSLTIRLDEELKPVAAGWQNYIIGVVAGFKKLGLELPPLKAVISSTVPLGSGLSSSAALEVAVATFLETVIGSQLDPWDKTRLCQNAEHEFAGMPCGIMDQFSSVFGKAGALMLLDCRSLDIQYIPFKNEELTFLVCNSNVKHALVDGEYALRRSQCESAARALGVTSLRDVTIDQLNSKKNKMDDVEYRRAKHVVTEIHRTIECAQAFAKNDWSRVGELMYRSHESLRADYEVSCSELDLLVEICRELGPDQGVLGSRMTGGGFGGSTVTLMKTSAEKLVMKKIADRYFPETQIQPTLFCCRPAQGARVV